MTLFLTKLLSALTSFVERFFAEILEICLNYVCAISKSTFNTFFIQITNFQASNISK